MGFRPSTDYPNGNMASLTDKMLGGAFHYVKVVAEAIEHVKYVAYNMASIVSVAQQNQDNQNVLNAQPTLEKLTVTGTNTVSALTWSYTGFYAIVFVNGIAYQSGFTLTSSQLTWDPTATGKVLTPGTTEVVIFYSATPH